MIRPRVLHVARDWVRPSEGFVLDVVRTTTATRASVACGVHHPGVPAPVPLRTLRARGRRGLRAELAAVALARRSEVLHAHFGYWAGHTAAVARRLNRPWVVALHGHDLLVEGCPAAVEADAVVVPSTFLADAASDAGVRDERLRVVPSGVDLAGCAFRIRTARPDGEVRVCFAGRFVEKKGVLDAARAMARAQERVPGLRCTFVGHGPLEGELRRYLAELGLAAEVLDGSLPGAVGGALDDTDLLLTASTVARDGDAESLGLVALEAQARGVPVVARATGGVGEAIGAGAGILVEGDGLGEALGGLAADPARWSVMGRAGRAHVALRYELGSRVADLEALWLSLAARGPLPTVSPTRERLPRVSVIVVTAGRRALVRRTLASLAAQSYPAELREVLVVDNASGDGTAGDLGSAVGVRVLTEPVHAPVAAARNRAAALAHGEVLAFTDDDCRPTPTWLESLVAGLRPGVALVQGATRADPGQEVRALSRTQWTPAEAGLYETSNVAYTAAAFHAVGGFDEKLAADVERVLGRRFGRYPFGEDTDLAWRVRRSGAPTRFAATAVVHHEVFAPDPRYLLRRAAVGAAWPVLLRRTPELASALSGRVLLGRQRVWVLAALAGLALAPADRRALVAALPWLAASARPLSPGRRGRLCALPVLAARDVVQTAALLYGSVRAGRLVL